MHSKKIHILKKTIFSLLLVFSFSLILSAQNTKKNYTISELKKTNIELETIVKEVGEIDDKLYTLCLNGSSDYFLKVVDLFEKKVLLTIPIIVSQKNGENTEFEDIVIIQDKLYVLENVFSQKNKTNALVGVELSKEGYLTKNLVFKNN